MIGGGKYPPPIILSILNYVTHVYEKEIAFCCGLFSEYDRHSTIQYGHFNLFR